MTTAPFRPDSSPPPPLEAVYVPSQAHDRPFEERLSNIVAAFGNRVRLSRLLPRQLGRITSESVYLNPSLPNVVLVRGGHVVGQTMGLLSAQELRETIQALVDLSSRRSGTVH